MSKAVVEEILANDLVNQTVSLAKIFSSNYFSKTNQLQARVGVALYGELERLAEKYPQLIKNLRGKGQG
jgi:4-aminobutyrate aminotransferase/(S)-3-amino-2-methylpropionate transaminase